VHELSGLVVLMGRGKSRAHRCPAEEVEALAGLYRDVSAYSDL
jgi:hypothetical protein